jgi:hypothetical protein
VIENIMNLVSPVRQLSCPMKLKRAVVYSSFRVCQCAFSTGHWNRPLDQYLARHQYAWNLNIPRSLLLGPSNENPKGASIPFGRVRG